MTTECDKVSGVITPLEVRQMTRPNVWCVVIATLVLLTGGVPLQAQTRACDAPQHRQFDFWVGDWRVETPSGQPAGSNRVELILGGCVLQENWTSTTGGEGRSFNLYSAATTEWHQTWVDGSGTLLQLDGGLRDGAMVLSGEVRGPNGSTTLNEISWRVIDGGRVRQHWRSSGDGGTTWTDVFIGIYIRAG